MSERERIQKELAEWLNDKGLNQPYGVIHGRARHFCKEER